MPEVKQQVIPKELNPNVSAALRYKIPSGIELASIRDHPEDWITNEIQIRQITTNLKASAVNRIYGANPDSNVAEKEADLWIEAANYGFNFKGSINRL